MENKNINIENFEGQQATHSGWMHYYESFSKFREEALRLGNILNGGNIYQASNSLKAYHGILYSMAQQIFYFYDESKEESLTKDWIELGKKVNQYLKVYNDSEMKKQMAWEMIDELPDDLQLDLLKFFNKIDRLAAEAGLLVNKEDKSKKETKKGLLGFG